MTISLRLISLALCFGAAAMSGQDNSEIKHFEDLIKSGQYQIAADELGLYTEAHPSSWQVLYQLGYVDFRLHRIQSSLTALCKSLVINKDSGESHKILAYDLNILGHQDMAMHELEQAIRCDSSNAEAHYELGRICYEQKLYLRSVKELEKASALNAGNVRTYHNLGLAYSAVGLTQKAVDSFEKGLRLNAIEKRPSPWPLIDYATYCNLQSNFLRARDLLLESIKIDQSYDQAYSELAKAYRGLSRADDAIDAMRRAIAINASNAEYHYMLGRLYTQTRHREEATQEFATYERSKAAGMKRQAASPTDEP